MKRSIALLTLLGGCAPEPAITDDPATSMAATSEAPTEGSTIDDATADGHTSDSVDDTGGPACSPWTDVELGWERDGDSNLPAVGGIARVAVGIDSGVVVAVTDETEEDADVTLLQLDPDGDEMWSLRYEGMAGLDDEVLDVAVAPDGSIYAVVREQTLELISEGFGNRYERTLVVLAMEPGGAPRWRYERVVPAPEYNDNARAAGLAVTDDNRVVVVDADATSEEIAPPRLFELDRFGNEISSIDLDVALSDAQLVDIDVSATGAVYVVVPRYGGSWVARVERDGAIAWVDDDDPGNVIATAVAAGDDDEAYVVVQTGNEEAGTGGFELRRYAADGTIEWSFGDEWPTPAGYAAAVVCDCDGAPLVVAELQDDADRSAWVGRFSPYGEPTSSTTLDSVRSIAPRSMALGGGGMLVVGGLEGGDELGPWVTRLDRP
jgi:hypothetical protein